MVVATLALVGVFVALYLMLYKLGVIGELSCSIGSCETVQLSRWSTFLGLPVAAWGLGFYVATLALALAGVRESLAASRGVALALVLMSGWGVVFSLYLTWLELFVIDAICLWCVVSAVIVLAMFVASLADFREKSGRDEGAEAGAAHGSPGTR